MSKDFNGMGEKFLGRKLDPVHFNLFNESTGHSAVFFSYKKINNQYIRSWLLR